MADEHKKPDFKKGVPAADLRDGSMIAGVFDGKGVLIARRGGRLFALSDECTHLGGPLPEGAIVGNELRCPWHQARFSLETGEAVAAPALQPLGCYLVEERDGTIIVTGKRDVPKSLPAAQSPLAGKDPGRVVIVGGGAAGHACADMLARSGFGARATVIAADPDAPYDRTFCSKQYLSGEAKRDDFNLDHNEIYQKAGVTLKIGAKVVSIDLSGKTVTIEGGDRQSFDALVLATGAEANRPPMPGLERPNAFTLRTRRDADAIIAACGSAKRVVILGASFIGLEAAAAMIQRKLAVHVVAPETLPLGKILGETMGEFVRGLHEKKGVAFHLGRKADSFDGKALRLDDGSTIEADFLILGLGVKPRVDLAKAAGLALIDPKEGGGVKVDGKLQTSAPGVYAVGDIASYLDPHSGRIRVEHWAHAERQGQFVARALMGQAETYTMAPFFWSAHYDASINYVGHADTFDEAKLEGDVDSGSFLVRYRRGGRDLAMAASFRDQEALAFDAELEGQRPI